MHVIINYLYRILYVYLKDRIRDIKKEDGEKLEVLNTTFIFVAFQQTLGWKLNVIFTKSVKVCNSKFSDLFVLLFFWLVKFLILTSQIIIG